MYILKFDFLLSQASAAEAAGYNLQHFCYGYTLY